MTETVWLPITVGIALLAVEFVLRRRSWAAQRRWMRLAAVAGWLAYAVWLHRYIRVDLATAGRIKLLPLFTVLVVWTVVAIWPWVRSATDHRS